jgi:tetratricopeptide (TPR) repeat protein
LLQLRQGQDREAASGALDAITGKLVNDAAPAQLAQAYVGLAEIELAKGNVAAARSALSSAAARRRDHPLLLEELAKAYADAFELDPAEREARRALAVSGRLTPRLILADVALRRSRPVQALTILEESGAKRPEALVLRALAKLELGRSPEARVDAELALHLDPSSVSASVALARIDLGEGKYEAASRRLEALEQKGKSAEVAWVLGQVYLARRMPDNARTCFRTALVRQPLLLQARLALARLLHDAGQLDEAREEIRRILATHAAYVPARRELAVLALEAGDAVAARDEFDALADRDADVDNLLGGARARLLLGDARGADERVERAIKLHPTGDDIELATCLKARALLLDRRPNEAIQLLLKSVRTAVRGEILALLIEAYLDYGRIDWAERATDLAPITARTGIELTLAKARLALAQARQQAAKALVEEALGRLKTMGRAPVWLRAQALSLEGQAELELGNARAAVRSLHAAIELDPRNARTQHTLGFALIDLKQIDEAATAFQAAVHIDPRYADAQYYLGWSWHSLSDPRAAEPLRAYLALEPRGALADDARRMLEGGDVTPSSDSPRNRSPEP